MVAIGKRTQGQNRAHGVLPRDRKGEFITEVFQAYKWMSADVQEAMFERYRCLEKIRHLAYR